MAHRSESEGRQLGDILGDADYMEELMQSSIASSKSRAASSAPSVDPDAILGGLAAMSGVDLDKLREEFWRTGPLAVVLDRLLGLGLIEQRHARPAGRPPAIETDIAVHAAFVKLLDQGVSEAEAKKQLPKVLFSQGIHNGRRIPEELTVASVRRSLNRYPRVWFEKVK